LDRIKVRNVDKLSQIKLKLSNLTEKEEHIGSELHRYKKYDRTVDDLFKKEIDKYKIQDDSF
jgi:hypothetical protein